MARTRKPAWPIRTKGFFFLEISSVKGPVRDTHFLDTKRPARFITEQRMHHHLSATITEIGRTPTSYRNSTHLFTLQGIQQVIHNILHCGSSGCIYRRLSDVNGKCKNVTAYPSRLQGAPQDLHFLNTAWYALKPITAWKFQTQKNCPFRDNV